MSRVTRYASHVTQYVTRTHTDLLLSHAGKMRRFSRVIRACKRPPRVQAADQHQVYHDGGWRQRSVQLLRVSHVTRTRHTSHTHASHVTHTRTSHTCCKSNAAAAPADAADPPCASGNAACATMLVFAAPAERKGKSVEMLGVAAPAHDSASRRACAAVSLATAARFNECGVLLMMLLLMYLTHMLTENRL